jgi:hypothetical protein
LLHCVGPHGDSAISENHVTSLLQGKLIRFRWILKDLGGKKWINYIKRCKGFGQTEPQKGKTGQIFYQGKKSCFK